MILLTGDELEPTKTYGSNAGSILGTKGSSKASSIPCSISSSKDSEQVGVHISTQVGIQSSKK